MPDITVIDLSDVELHDESSTGQTEEQLQQEYDLGQPVEVPDGEGIIAAFVESNFEFPVGAEDRVERIEEEDEEVEMKEIEASSENPMYIVSLLEGGSVAVSADEIEEIPGLEGEGEEIESPEEVMDEGSEAETAPVYAYCDDPSNTAQLEAAKVKYIHENYAEELAAHVNDGDTSLAQLEQMSSEELVNIRGVDDPHVGFSELPPGWTRKSVLQAWASLGGMWRTCFARMVARMGPNFAKRWCSALKDEVLRTEEWRGKF
jgi:hypothetical protein